MFSVSVETPIREYSSNQEKRFDYSFHNQYNETLDARFILLMDNYVYQDHSVGNIESSEHPPDNVEDAMDTGRDILGHQQEDRDEEDRLQQSHRHEFATENKHKE
ncbi:hypothetical protein WDU94_004350 [Cyamophila willieti]